MSTTPSALVTAIRTKHPGAYDDLSDQELESRVLAKYPQYQDMANSPTMPVAGQMSPYDMKYAGGGFTPSVMGGAVKDLATGTGSFLKDLFLKPGMPVTGRGAPGSSLVEKYVDQPAEQENKMGQELTQAGHPIAGAIQQGIAKTVPFVGPPIGQALESMREGNYGGPTAQLGAMYAGGKVAGKFAPSSLRRGMQESLNIGPDLTAKAVETYKTDMNAALTKHSEDMANTKFEHQQEVSQLINEHKATTQDALIAQAKQIQDINTKYNAKLSDIDAKHTERVNAVNKANELEQKQAAQRTQLENEAKAIQQHVGDHLLTVSSEALNDAKSTYPKIKGTVPSEELNGMVKGSLGKLQGSTKPPPSLKTILDDTRAEPTALEQASVFGARKGGGYANASSMLTSPNMSPAAKARFLASLSPEEQATLKAGEMMGRGSKEIPFDKLHGYYSEIGKELGNPNLAPDHRAALSDAYAGIGGKMRSMAKSEGVEDQFNQAQGKYKDVMQTFYNHKPLSSGGSPVAKALQAVDPNYSAQTGEYASKYLTGSLADKAIAQLGKFTDLGARPELVQLLKDKLSQIDALPSSAKFKEAPTHPGYPARPSYPEPKVPNVPDMSGAVKVTPPKLPEEVDPQALKAQAVQKLATTLRGTGGLRLSLDLLSIMRAIKSADPSLLLYPIGRRVAGRALESPGAMDWLTKPTPEEMQSLPKTPTIKVEPRRP